MRANPLNLILASIVFALLFLQVFPLEASCPFQGQINASGTNVRSDSTVSSEIISTLNKGERVEVLEELYDWYKIRLPKSSPSYIKKSFLECLNYRTTEPTNAPSQPEAKKECISAKVLRDRVNIRLHPSTSSVILGVADKNEVVNILKEEGEWSRIEPIANSFGWINKRFLIKIESAKEEGTSTVTVSPQPQPEENVTLIGIINPYGRFFRRLATHKLVTQDNKVFLLKGDKKSLDSLCWHKVKVMGKRIDEPGQKFPVIEVRILEVAN